MARYGLSSQRRWSVQELRDLRAHLAGCEPAGVMLRKLNAGEIFHIWDSDAYGLDQDVSDHLDGILRELGRLVSRYPDLRCHYAPSATDAWEMVPAEVLKNLLASDRLIREQLDR
ncbi:MAG: hypothetical protein AB1758_02260 [Candidatus Eremiobacterota bacterium]